MDQPNSPLLPPQSLEAERAVLGCLLLSGNEVNQNLDVVFELLKEQHFYNSHHQKIFNGLRAQRQQDKPIDLLTVAEYLNQLNLLEEIGGHTYLGELVNAASSAANVLVHAHLVRERSLHRDLIEVGNNIAKLGYQPENRELNALLDKAEAMVFEIAQTGSTQTPFKPIRPLLLDVTKHLDELKHRQSDITGFATGFKRLDAMTAGLQRGDLIVVAGRPSMGKTTLAMNIADYVSSHSGDYLTPTDKRPVVGIFSMEMGAEQLVLRMFSSIGSIQHQNLRTGNLSDAEWDKLFAAGEQLRERQVFIDDQSGLSVLGLRTRARRLKREQPDLSLLVVDYLQLLNVDRKFDNRNAEVTEISRMLKEMARELNIPVIVVSQLNRAVDNRQSHRPMMSDLRESGSIEQDADVIMFIHRGEFYDPTDENLKGQADLIVSKQRNGETGDIKLIFQGPFSRFGNPLDEQQAQQYFAAE